jgi:hypothetical protein
VVKGSLKPQTTIQILRCFTLGGYTARVVERRLETEGPQSLAGPLPASIRANRDELIAFLNEWADGVWPPAPRSELRKVQESKDCGLATVLDAVEAALIRIMREDEQMRRTGIIQSERQVFGLAREYFGLDDHEGAA